MTSSGLTLVLYYLDGQTHEDHDVSRQAPSVRKDIKPENTRVQPPQGVPMLQTARISACSPRWCVCVRAWFKSGEVRKRQWGMSSREFGSQHTQSTQRSDKI